MVVLFVAALLAIGLTFFDGARCRLDAPDRETFALPRKTINTKSMITEVIRYKVPAAQAAAFEEAYKKTEPILQNSSHCLGYSLFRGVEEPENWMLMLSWDSVEGHEQGFRLDPGFREFFGLVKPFLGQVQEMKHYHASGLNWSRSSQNLSTFEI